MEDYSDLRALAEGEKGLKGDIAALNEPITDKLKTTLTGNARKQARRGYDRARTSAGVHQEDMSERGPAQCGSGAGRRIFA